MSKRLDEMEMDEKSKELSSEEIDGMIGAKKKSKAADLKAWLKGRSKPLSEVLGQELIIHGVEFEATQFKDGQDGMILRMEVADGTVYYTTSEVLVKQMKEYVDEENIFPLRVIARKEGRHYTFA